MTRMTANRPDKPSGRRFTRAEYYRMAEMGFFEGQRVELIDGEVVEMPALNPPHSAATKRAERRLEAAFGSGFQARVQQPLSLGTSSDPEPDVAIVPDVPDDYASGHPTTALLVVEVSETTLRYDQTVKGSLYAAAGLPEYWVVNLVDRELEVHRRPVADAAAPHGSAYDDVAILGPADTVTPLAAPQARVAVADLLP
jgi:Uma2 family endonuclease